MSAAQRSARLAAYRSEFNGLQDCVGAVVQYGNSYGSMRADDRLRHAAAAGLNEAIPGEGGFILPVQQTEVWSDRIVTESKFLRRVTRRLMSGSKMTWPAIDETARADGSRLGGVKSYWKNEATTAPPSKPKFRKLEFNTKKVIGFIYATAEQGNNVPALTELLELCFVSEAIFMVEDAALNGLGTDRPLGILTQGNNALITVSPPSGIATQSLTGECLQSMQGRLTPELHGRAIWMMSLDNYNQIAGGSFSNGQPIVQYLGDRRFILGHELILCEQTAPLGQLYDVLLVDPTMYILAVRSQEYVSSIHLQWLADEMCFRFVLRLDGQCGWKSAVTPRNGTVPASPYITLAAR